MYTYIIKRIGHDTDLSLATLSRRCLAHGQPCRNSQKSAQSLIHTVIVTGCCRFRIFLFVALFAHAKRRRVILYIIHTYFIYCIWPINQIRMCVYMCAYVYIYVYTYVYMYVCIYVYIHVYISICVYMCTYLVPPCSSMKSDRLRDT